MCPSHELTTKRHNALWNMNTICVVQMSSYHLFNFLNKRTYLCENYLVMFQRSKKISTLLAFTLFLWVCSFIDEGMLFIWNLRFKHGKFVGFINFIRFQRNFIWFRNWFDIISLHCPFVAEITLHNHNFGKTFSSFYFVCNHIESWVTIFYVMMNV